MLSCVIVDDEPRAISILEEYVEDVDFLKLVRTFRNPVEAIAFLNKTEVQLLFLDINMPGIDGLQIPGMVKYNPMVIFTTAYSEYAVESYELDVVDYLLKPIEFSRFVKAATRANRKWQNASALGQVESDASNSHTIYIKSGPQLHRLEVADILYLEKDGHYLIFHLADKKVLARMNIRKALDMLPVKHFLQIHKSFIVSLRHIKVVENHQVIVSDNRIPVGATFREKLMKVIDVKN